MRKGMCTGLRDAYICIGALDYDEFENPALPDLFKVFGGYPYNPLTMTRVLGARMPGVTPEMIDKAFFDERDEVPPYEEQPWHVSPEHEARLGESMGWAMSTESLPEPRRRPELARSLRAQRPDLTVLTDSALHARARSMVPYIQQTFENAMHRVVAVVARHGRARRDLRGPRATRRWRSACWPGSRSTRPRRRTRCGSSAARAGASAECQRGVRRRARPGARPARSRAAATSAASFLEQFDQFLRDYGSRGQNEYDPRSPSWEVKPRIALAAIDLMRKSDDVAGARHPPKRVGRRARSASRPRSARQIAGDPETAGLVRGRAAVGAAVPRRSRTGEDERA